LYGLISAFDVKKYMYIDKIKLINKIINTVMTSAQGTRADVFSLTNSF
jgi:hypothetical protein